MLSRRLTITQTKLFLFSFLLSQICLFCFRLFNFESISIFFDVLRGDDDVFALNEFVDGRQDRVGNLDAVDGHKESHDHAGELLRDDDVA